MDTMYFHGTKGIAARAVRLPNGGVALAISITTRDVGAKYSRRLEVNALGLQWRLAERIASAINAAASEAPEAVPMAEGA